MTTLHTVHKFPLSQTYIAPENVRSETVHDADGLKLLAGSIRHFGRLLEPLKAYIDDEGKVAVWDGGRRYTALRLIEADADGVGRVITDGVDVYVTTKEEAAAASLATFVREDMHPADQFLAYNAMFDTGMAPEQIAAAFAVEAKTVSQLLRFRTLAPEVLEAFRAGRFGLDVCYAFTLTTDHDKQCGLLQGDGDLTTYGVKRALTEGAVTARDKWARFIGREAYEAAGGTFLMDLFSQHSADEQWSNGDLVKSLAQQKLNAMEADFLAEGWGAVIVSQDAYGWQGGYGAMKAEGPTKKGQPRAFTAEQKAKGVVFIVFGYGDMEVKPGYEKLGKVSDPNAPKPLAKAEPARYGWGHKGHHVMTQAATEATRVALVLKPDVAMVALATQLAWAILRGPRYGHVSDQLASRFVPAERNGRPPAVEVLGQDLVQEKFDEWSARLPKEQIAFCDAIAALGAGDLQSLTALCFAMSLAADEEKYESWIRQPQRWAHLGWMARAAGVDVVKAWKPTWEFINGGSKDALLSVITSDGDSRDAKPETKKAHLSDIVANIAIKKGWRPELLTTFMDVKDPEPKAGGDLGIPSNEDEHRDARTEDEYLGWIAEAFINDLGHDAAEAQDLAKLALAMELADGPNGFGDESYNWGRSDAASSAVHYLDAQNESEGADAE